MNFKVGRIIFLSVTYNVFVVYSDASTRHMYEIY